MQTLQLIIPRVLLCVVFACMPFKLEAQAQPVQGFVDLHSHLMGEHSFGGSWFWGRLAGPENEAVARCDGGFLSESHASLAWPGLAELVSGYDGGWHLGKRRGFDNRSCWRIFGIPIPGTCPRPNYAHWPHWEAIAHQQMWEGWVREARDGGLRVMVASLAESNFLCINTPVHRRRYDCNEMNSVIRQAQFANEFVSQNSNWVGIATSPAEARQLIDQGRLALVLAVEATQLFPEGDAVQQLQQLHDLGVRSVQLTHHANNRFSGAAPLPELMKTASLIELLWAVAFRLFNITDINDIICTDANGERGDCDGEIFLNQMALTEDGELLLQAMMERGMLLDVAHMSRRAFGETFNLAMANGAYPLMNSHTHLWSVIEPDGDDTHHEKYLLDAEFDMIRQTGGMAGLRTGPEETIAYAAPLVPGDCGGSGRSFAQSLMFAVDNDLTVGFGADFNGFIAQSRPCPEVENSDQLRDHGLAHVGLLPALVEDLRDAGLDQQYLDALNGSAEQFLQMWERAEAIAGIEPSQPAPVARCIADPRTAKAPFLLSTLDASGSTSVAGITHYVWNFDDGNGFHQTTVSPTVDHLFIPPDGPPHEWGPRVRVFDINGQFSEAWCGLIEIQHN